MTDFKRLWIGAFLGLTLSVASVPSHATETRKWSCSSSCRGLDSVFTAAGVPPGRLGLIVDRLPSIAAPALERADFVAVFKAMRGHRLDITLQPDRSLAGAAGLADARRGAAALTRAWKQAGLPADKLKVTVGAASRAARR